MLRSKMIVAAAASAVLAMLAAPAFAQDFPNREIKLVVPFPPGASTDGAARVLQPALAEELGQPVIVENLPGAGGSVGTGQIARGDADGYTVLLTVNAPIVMAPYLFARLPYDTSADLRAVGLFAETYLALTVKADSPFQSVDDVIAAAKERPGEITFGSSGIGSGHQIAGALLNDKAGIDTAHIPFQGGGPSIESLLGGHIDMAYTTLPSIAPHVASGAVRVLAMVELERAQAHPDVPLLSDFADGAGIATTWLGVFVPKSVPDDVVQRLSDALVAAMARENVVNGLTNIGITPFAKSASEADEIVARDLEFWREAIGIAGIEPQ